MEAVTNVDKISFVIMIYSFVTRDKIVSVFNFPTVCGQAKPETLKQLECPCLDKLKSGYNHGSFCPYIVRQQSVVSITVIFIVATSSLSSVLCQCADRQVWHSRLGDHGGGPQRSSLGWAARLYSPSRRHHGGRLRGGHFQWKLCCIWKHAGMTPCGTTLSQVLNLKATFCFVLGMLRHPLLCCLFLTWSLIMHYNIKNCIHSTI